MAAIHHALAAYLLRWGRPTDAASWTALFLGISLLGLGLSGKMARIGRPWPELIANAKWRWVVVGSASLAATLLSIGYISIYLRGGPRIIDATSYLLEARTFAEGSFTFATPSPSASFRGRFLLFHEGRLGVIFPPGYPILLALGVWSGAPLLIGPLLGGAIVMATYAVTHEVVSDSHIGASSRKRESIAALAAILSVLSATLRYHTADTMSHASAALGLTVAFAAGLRGRRLAKSSWFIVAGAAIGWVLATRPLSALPIGGVVFLLAITSSPTARSKNLACLIASAVPGVLFLAAWHRALTGSALVSPQAAYYAVSDGPAGCFRYGFGPRVGCVFEHGDVVRADLQNGFHWLRAVRTTLHRIGLHLADIANFEPLAVLAVVPAFRKFAWPSTMAPTVALALVGLHITAYAPFYFDGSYPGGGARFYADILPLEHALVAIGLTRVFLKWPYLRRAVAVIGLSLLGFAFHTVRDHVALAHRDGGRPMFEPAILASALPASPARKSDERRTRGKGGPGVVFFDSDHGYNLAYRPGANPLDEIIAARFRGDDHDRLLWEWAGRPPAYRYRFGQAASAIVPMEWTGGATTPHYRFEGEADWPPIAQSAGYAIPIWATDSCASGGRALALFADENIGRAMAIIELPVPTRGVWRITPSVLVNAGSSEGSMTVFTGESNRFENAVTAAEPWQWAPSSTDGVSVRCASLPQRRATLAAYAWLEIENRNASHFRRNENVIWLDKTELDKAESEEPH